MLSSSEDLLFLELEVTATERAAAAAEARLLLQLTEEPEVLI